MAQEWKGMFSYHQVQREGIVMQAIGQGRYIQIPWPEEKGKRKHRLWSVGSVLASHMAFSSLQ